MEELERAVGASATKAQRWASVPVVAQAGENTDTTVQSRHKWAKIYALFGAQGEAQMDEVFGAVNYYFLRNGASPRGKYTKPVRTAGGLEKESGEVVKITGRLEGEIRQFLRGRLEDSYLFLKHNAQIKEDPYLVTMAENAGVSREYVWLMADWLGRDCPYFVGQEADVYNILRTSKIAAASAKRAEATPEVDRVKMNTPETKMSHRGHQPSYNDDLF